MTKNVRYSMPYRFHTDISSEVSTRILMGCRLVVSTAIGTSWLRERSPSVLGITVVHDSLIREISE